VEIADEIQSGEIQSCIFLDALLLGGASATLSAAQEPTNVWDTPWRFSFDAYGWMPSAPATIKIAGNEVASIPETFDNILDSL
jgi:hypothetical protein